MTVRPKPTIENPLRARVSYPTGWATFDSPEHARIFSNHPGHIPLAVACYLEHFRETGRSD
ncbi:hypothetical protein M2388_000366 [Leucobacter aridicollis]|nr:hypothetical protein [Leucobacter aridicollis]